MPITAPPPRLLNGASLFLDFDGTLVELAERPDAVVVGDALRTLLAGLAKRLEGRLAIVSGRSVDQVRGFLGDGLMVSGSHGLEMAWTDGRTQTPDTAGWIGDALDAAEQLRRLHPGMVIEVKPFGVALHYRGAPDAADAAALLAQELAAREKLHVQPGKMMWEVRVGGRDKGDAVRQFMADPALAGTTPVFVGDDVTDEAAFAAAAAMGGHGVLVGPPRDSAATFRLDDVAATLRWLETASEEMA